MEQQTETRTTRAAGPVRKASRVTARCGEQLKRFLADPDGITAIVGFPQMGKSTFTKSVYDYFLLVDQYPQVIVYDPQKQIDSYISYAKPEDFQIALDEIYAENQDRIDYNEEPVQTAVFMDEADGVIDQWCRKDNIRDRMLRYGRNLGLNLFMNFRTIPNYQIKKYANNVVVFKNYEDEYIEKLCSRHRLKVAPADLKPFHYFIIKR